VADSRSSSPGQRRTSWPRPSRLARRTAPILRDRSRSCSCIHTRTRGRLQGGRRRNLIVSSLSQGEPFGWLAKSSSLEILRLFSASRSIFHALDASKIQIPIYCAGGSLQCSPSSLIAGKGARCPLPGTPPPLSVFGFIFPPLGLKLRPLKE